MKKVTDLQEFNAEDLQRIKRFRLLDDDFMSKVFEDRECAEILLQVILDKRDLKVQQVRVQYSIKNLQGRSVRLDIFAVDSVGKLYNIEVQRDDKGAGIKRARYNSSLLDANITEPGDEYEALPETYVIFITENDILKRNLPIYHIDRVIRETKELFNDEEHIIYVNAQKTDETDLGKLMQDFHCTDAKDMNNPVLAKRVSYFKEEKEGVTLMCKEMEKMRDEARIEGRTEERKASIRNMLVDRVPYEKIKQYANATDKEIAEVEKEMIVK